jgi:hypothetical protein
MDWFALFSNGLWILGLAVIVSAFSVAYWQAAQSTDRVGKVISRAIYQYVLTFGALSFSLGVGFSLKLLAWRVFWFALALLLILRGLFLRRTDES